MANEEHLAILKQGLKVWNEWRRGFPYAMIRPDLSEANLSGTDLRAATLRGTDLSRADLSRADLSRADLSRANLSGAILRGTSLRGANLIRATLSGATLSETDFVHATLYQTDLSQADLRSCRVEGARGLYQTAPLSEPSWPSIDAQTLLAFQREAAEVTTPPERLLELASSWPGYLVRQQIAANPNTPARLLAVLGMGYPEAVVANPQLPMLLHVQPPWLSPTQAQALLAALARSEAQAALTAQFAPLLHMITGYAGVEPLARLRQGVEAWNAWRRDHPTVLPDLREADLSGTDLRQINLSRANLSQANLSRATLREANLSRAILRGARLNQADLSKSDLSRADLRRADLSQATLSLAIMNQVDLSQADLSEATLSGADLRFGTLYRTKLHRTDLSQASIKWTDLSGTDLSAAILPLEFRQN